MIFDKHIHITLGKTEVIAAVCVVVVVATFLAHLLSASTDSRNPE